MKFLHKGPFTESCYELHVSIERFPKKNSGSSYGDEFIPGWYVTDDAVPTLKNKKKNVYGPFRIKSLAENFLIRVLRGEDPKQVMCWFDLTKKAKKS